MNRYEPTDTLHTAPFSTWLSLAVIVAVVKNCYRSVVIVMSAVKMWCFVSVFAEDFQLMTTWTWDFSEHVTKYDIVACQ